MANIKLRRGLKASLIASVLSDGEICFTTDTKEIYIGFGGINYQVGGAAALGDMLKSIYDTDNDGIVDWAENVNWAGVQGKPSAFAPPVATSSVLGGVKVGANLSVAADGVLSGNSIPESFIPKQERFTITAGQTTFDLVKGYYTAGSLTWSIYGFQQPKESITEVTSTSFSIPAGLPDGTEFEVQYIQTVNLVPFPYHKAEHLPGGVDDLGLNAVALSGSYADLSGKPAIPTTLPANGGNADTVGGKLPSVFYQDGSVIMNTNPFGGKRLYINSLNNGLFVADKRYVVTGTRFDAANVNLGALTPSELATLFNGNYEDYINIPADQHIVVNIIFNGGTYPGYPYGDVYLSHYYVNYSQSAKLRTYTTYVPHVVGWHEYDFVDFYRSGTSNLITTARNPVYQITQMEFEIHAPATTPAQITQVDFKLDRPGTTEMPILDKFRPNNIYDDLTMKDVNKSIAFVLKRNGQMQSNLAIGTPPLTVVSTTKVANLNVDMLDGCTVNDAGTTAFDLWTAIKVMTALALKADLASPAFTGTPTAPTPVSSDSTTKLATTAFVAAAVTALVNSSPATLDTLRELADALGDDPNYATTTAALIGTKAPLVSPALTGAPTAPTPATADSSTIVATTAFVKAQGYITSAGSGAKIAVATVAPSTPSAGDFWYKVI